MPLSPEVLCSILVEIRGGTAAPFRLIREYCVRMYDDVSDGTVLSKKGSRVYGFECVYYSALCACVFMSYFRVLFDVFPAVTVFLGE